MSALRGEQSGFWNAVHPLLMRNPKINPPAVSSAGLPTVPTAAGDSGAGPAGDNLREDCYGDDGEDLDPSFEGEQGGDDDVNEGEEDDDFSPAKRPRTASTDGVDVHRPARGTQVGSADRTDRTLGGTGAAIFSGGGVGAGTRPSTPAAPAKVVAGSTGRERVTTKRGPSIAKTVSAGINAAMSDGMKSYLDFMQVKEEAAARARADEAHTRQQEMFERERRREEERRERREREEADARRFDRLLRFMMVREVHTSTGAAAQAGLDPDTAPPSPTARPPPESEQ